MFLATPFTAALGFLLGLVSFFSNTLSFFVAEFGSGFLQTQLLVIKIFSIIQVPLPIPFNIASTIIAYYVGLAIFIFMTPYEND